MLNKTVTTFSPVPITNAGWIVPGNGGSAVFSLMGAEYLSITAASIGTHAWSDGVLTLKVSNRREGPFTVLPTSVTVGHNSPVSSIVDVRAYAYAVLDVTTTHANVVLDIAVCLYAAA